MKNKIEFHGAMEFRKSFMLLPAKRGRVKSLNAFDTLALLFPQINSAYTRPD